METLTHKPPPAGSAGEGFVHAMDCQRKRTLSRPAKEQTQKKVAV